MSDILDRIKARREAKPSISFHVDEWGCTIYVRPLSAAQLARLQKQGDIAKKTCFAIIWGALDADGKQMFSDDADTLSGLLSEDHEVIDRVSSFILRPELIDKEAAKN